MRLEENIKSLCEKVGAKGGLFVALLGYAVYLESEKRLPASGGNWEQLIESKLFLLFSLSLVALGIGGIAFHARRNNQFTLDGIFTAVNETVRGNIGVPRQ